MEITLRREMPADYKSVERVTREAFWNLYVPGCSEHYLAHVLREHRDFVPELDYVALVADQIVGSIMYTRSKVINAQQQALETLTFGPVCVLPEYQKQGIGSALIQHTILKAKARNCPAIVIYGNPKNYCKHGFKSCKDYNLSTMEGKYPYAMLVLELEAGAFQGQAWRYQDSDAYNVDPGQVEEFDRLFEPKAKGYQYTQEEFRMSCRAYIE